MLLVAIGMAMFRGLGMDTTYWFILAALFPLVAGIALTMSPMTAAIMSAVPARRAGAGSAMNDATRELGAALGVAVVGSLAASHYASTMQSVVAGLPAAVQDAALSSLGGALQAAQSLPPAQGAALTTGAQSAFVGGLQMAVTIGAVLAAIAAVCVWRFLPHTLAPEGALHGGGESIEDVVELGIAGVPPVFPDSELADVVVDHEPGAAGAGNATAT
jgi:hypothetical protein